MHPRNLLALAHDLVAAGLVWAIAYWLRFNLDVPAYYLTGMWLTLPIAVVVPAACFLGFRLYGGLWRYASLVDLQRIVLAVSVAALAVGAAVFLFDLRERVPRTVLLLYPMLLLFAMGGSRFMFRAWREHRQFGQAHVRGEPVVVLGAGQAAASLIRELQRSNEWRVVGCFDDDSTKLGQRVHGVKVLGHLASVGEWARRMHVKRAIVALPSVAPNVRRHAVEAASLAGLAVLTVPSFDDLIAGRLSISQVRNVELEDLLGREQVELDEAGIHKLLTGRVVAVTGAGGSIGSELCRQVAKHEPALLILYEHNEFALYRIEQEFRERMSRVPILAAIGDIKDTRRLRTLFEEHRPAVVFHAAAYKHVPLMESVNSSEAVRNNVLGSYCVASTAAACGVETFIMISTDKAVNPTNIMGATKRLAEMVCQALQGMTHTRFVTVRFGNVLGSNGSVIPRFREQIAAGGPVTVTHPDIERYFMSIPEAARLVLQAGLIGQGGEILVLDMGEPVKIVELARNMIRLSGFSEDEIKIVFTGLRPGEKLYEELLAHNEHTLPTPHPKLRVAQAIAPRGDAWLKNLLDWLSRSAELDDQEVRATLREWVKEYQPEPSAPEASAQDAVALR